MITKFSMDLSKNTKNIDIVDKTQYGAFWFLDYVFDKENFDLFLSKDRLIKFA